MAKAEGVDGMKGDSVMWRALAAIGMVSAVALAGLAQQLPDKTFRPALPKPAWAEGAGPRLCLDEAHHNFHTLDNRFWAFGELARRDTVSAHSDTASTAPRWPPAIYS